MDLGLQYGAVGVVPDLLQDILKQRMLEREMQRRLAEDAAQQEAMRKRLALEQQRVGYKGEELGLRKADEARKAELFPIEMRGKQVGVETAETDLSKKKGDIARRDAALEHPVIQGLRPYLDAGVPLGSVSPTDPTGALEHQRELELAETRGKWNVRAAGAGVSASMNRPVYRTVPGFDPQANIPVTYLVAIDPSTGQSRIMQTIAGRPSADQLNKVTELMSVADQAQTVKDYYDPQLVGPVQGNATKVASRLGVTPILSKMAGDDEVQAFKRNRLSSAVASMQNMLLYARTGKQINEAEFARMMKELPDINMMPQQFEARMDLSMRNLKLIRDRISNQWLQFGQGQQPQPNQDQQDEWELEGMIPGGGGGG